MSHTMLSKPFWHIALSVLIGVALALVLGCWGLPYVAGSGLRSVEPDTSVGLASISATGAYTVHLPFLGSCCSTAVPPFAVQTYGALNSAGDLDEIADAGARWIRVPISWRSIEPTDTTPANYHWSGLDASVANAEAEGVQLILTLGGQPSWAAILPEGPVTNTEDILEFAGALVERYDDDGVDDAPGSPQVNHFELYNEPDNGDPEHAAGGFGCWGDFKNEVPGCGDAEDYAALLQALHPVMKDASSQANLVFGGLALDWFASDGGPFDPDFMETVLAECQGQDCFDVMNFHYYPPFRRHWEPYGPGIIGKANSVRETLEAYGRGEMPIICTETSWYSAGTWGSHELQSRYAVKGYVRGMAAGLDVVTWFWAQDGGYDVEPGLLDDDLQPKDAYRAYQEMTTRLGTAIYQRPLTAAETGDERIEGYVFQTCRGRLDVVWTEDDDWFDAGDPTLPLTVEATSLRVVDKFGNETVYRDEDDGATDGRVTVSVGGSPLYLEYGA